MEPRYHINVFQSLRDESWAADVPDLKSCAAFGDTPEQAPAEARVAIRGCLEATRAAKMLVPESRYRPGIYPA